MDHLAVTSSVGQRSVAGLVWYRTHQTASGTCSRMSRDSSVGIATGYGLDGRRVRVLIPVGAVFSHLHVVLAGSGTPGLYPVGTRGYSNGAIIKCSHGSCVTVVNKSNLQSRPLL
jgi:hypothetical protein